MTFNPKTWLNGRDGTTRTDAAALIDMEERLSDYTDLAVTEIIDPGILYLGAYVDGDAPVFDGGTSSLQPQQIVTADALNTEALARGTGDTDEAAARSAADDVLDSRIAVLRESPVMVTDERFAAVLDGTADASAGIQAALDQAATAIGAGFGSGECAIPPNYLARCDGPLDLPGGVKLEGLAGRGQTHLVHNFNGDFVILNSANTIKNLYLEQGIYRATGKAIAHTSIAGQSVGFMTIEGIVVTGDPGGAKGFEYDVWLDGSANDALPGPGLRSTWIRNCQFFGCYTDTATVVLESCIHCFISDTEIMSAPEDTAVQGLYIKNAISQWISWNGGVIDGDVYSDGSHVSMNCYVTVDGTITFAPTATHNVLMGDVDLATLSDLAGDPSNRLITGL